MSEYANYDDYNDPDEENEYDALRGKKITVEKIIKKTLLYTLRLLALCVFAILLWRIFVSSDPKSMQNFVWNEETIKIYNDNPSEFVAYYYKHKDNLTKDGKFAASYVYYVPKTGQFQITLRYNDSTIKSLMEKYSLANEPSGEQFVFTLTDNAGNTYTEYEYISCEKSMYNYRRLIFDGIDMTPLTVDNPSVNATEEERENIQKEKEKVLLTLNVYYKDDVLLSKPYGKITVYDYSYYHEPINMKNYIPKENKPTEGLIARMEYTVKEEPAETTGN